jgi:SAM-dependent methyltransferase
LNTPEAAHVFTRSGLAALSDLERTEYRELFSILEGEQQVFLQRESEYRSKAYKWPRDALHWWSRLWEYPYVYYHLTRHLGGLSRDSGPTVADMGSGVTFFPFALAKMGLNVVCADIDPICENDIRRASEVVSHAPGMVEFRLIDKSKVPFEDGELDAVYSISVLEHIPKCENALAEVSRVLKPGGLFLLTFDLGLDAAGREPLNVAQYEHLLPVIKSRFDLVWPERTVHPRDVLTSRNSPYRQGRVSYLAFGWQLLTQRVLTPLRGRKPGPVTKGLPALAVMGLILQKRR